MSETSSVFIENKHVKKEYSYYLESCPICENRRFKPLFSHDGFQYFICRKCSFVFVNPRLNDKGSSIWYNSDYYNAALGKEIYINRGNERYFSVSLNSLHFSKVIGTIESKFVNKNISIMDVGCSTGSLLAYLRDKSGFLNLKGIDLNSKAVDFAMKHRKLNVKASDINDIEEEEQFDLVINTENIEHVNDLNKYILNLKKIIKPNGYLLISTPHNDLRALKRYGLFADHFCAPNHINYFNKETIESFLKKNGFLPQSVFMDKAWGFNLYSFIKSKLFITDQVAAEAPNEAYFSGPIMKYKKNRKSLIRLKKIDSDFNGMEDINHKGKGIKSLIKKILSIQIGEPYNTHMVLLARKID